MTRVLIIGMSHVGALIRALVAVPRKNWTVINVRQEKLDLLRDPAARQSVVARAGQVDVLVLAMEGNYHNVLSLLNDPRPFYVLPAAPQGQFIPQDMMLAHLTAHHERTLKLERCVVEMFPDAQRMLLDPPPPAGDAAHIQRFPGIFADKIGMGVSPDGLRLAVYELQSRVFAAHARALDARFIPSPMAARDATGKLAARFWNTDPTHGNSDYGQLVFDAIDACIGEKA